MNAATAASAPSGRGLTGALRDALPLLAGIGLLLVGSGLTATLVGVRAGLEGFRPGVIGVVLAGYYLGYVGGSYFAPPAIVRVGHIRVFAGLGGLASAAILIHLLLVDPFSWFVLRVVVGLCVSALYVVCETWLNGVTTNRTRGSLFAVYMIVVSGSLLGGQIVYGLVGASGFEPFVIASVLVALAVVPVSLAVFPAVSAPRPEPVPVRTIFRIAPLAVIGTTVSGFIGAAMLSAGVVYATESGFDQGATGAFIGASLAGGVLLQLPLGAWSDRVDRRLVIAVTAVAGMAAAIIASQIPTDRRLVLIALTLVAGGAGFPIYSLCSAHLNDYIDDEIKVAAGSKIVLVNGIGAVAGPIVGSFVIGQISPGSLYLVTAAGFLVVAADAFYRMTRRSAAEEEARARFVPVVVGPGPTAVLGSDVAGAAGFTVTRGGAVLDDLTVYYTEQGAGLSIVLVGGLDGGAGPALDSLTLPLVTNGFHVIVPALGVRSDVADACEAVTSVLGHLAFRSATFVGLGSGAQVVQQFAQENRDRVDAVVLVVEPGSVRDFDVEIALGKPTLVLDRSLLETSASDMADDIAEFVRPIARTIAVQWETGRFDAVPPDP